MNDQELTIDVSSPAETSAIDTAAYGAFVDLAYRAVFDRTPSPGEVEGQVSTLAGGVSHSVFLAALLVSPEKLALDEVRQAERKSVEGMKAQAAEFIPMAYRAVFEREVDEGGLQTGMAYFSDEGTFSGFLGLLFQSEEAQHRHGNRDGQARRAVYRAMDPERFVRLAFEAVLNREADDGAIASYVAELEERMTPGDFIAALAGSPEGQNLKRQQGMAPVFAACGLITAMLEGMLRKRGVVLNLGPVPTFDAPAHVVEAMLRSLTATIEMLLERDVAAAA